MNALVYSSSMIAAFLGGILALFAPCCVVSLLPTFTATAIERGRRRLPLTALLFAAGVAAILLPIVLGIGALGQLFAGHRREVFLVVGLFLAFLGVSILAGKQWMLPMPALSLRTSGAGGGRVFLLGLVSGIASSCCAPVVAGVVAMSALSASIFGALGLGLAYVFGMVFPLFLAALFWDRLPLQNLRFRPRASPVRIQGRALSWTDLVAAGMFLAVAAVALYLAASGQMSYSPDWLTAWNRWATGMAGNLAVALRGVPAVAQAAVLVLLAAAIGVALYWSSTGPTETRPKTSEPTEPISGRGRGPVEPTVRL
ncbi:MAG TPA: cytochrome c biogenesis CcdA family protein [Candidatus Dormibacteraeota bacterium]